jgi:hypothetical protein
VDDVVVVAERSVKTREIVKIVAYGATTVGVAAVDIAGHWQCLTIDIQCLQR